jgi:RHS repeat-associated protein
VGNEYIGDDERVEVQIGTDMSRRFVHDESGRLIGEYGATGVVNAEHVWLMPDSDEGGWEPLALLGSTTLSYVHGDHLGVPVVITNPAGTSINDMQAEPFGRRFRTASGAQPRTSIALPGQIIDIADRHYNMYRDYDPTLGRYLQADPIGLEGGDNVYGYVGGNPVNQIDPTGRNPVAIGFGAVRLFCSRFPSRCAAAAATLAEAVRRAGNAATDSIINQRGNVGGCEDADGESERCREVLDNCRDICTSRYVDDPESLPGTGTNRPARMRRCIRECMAAHGCNNF